jgi:phosphoesterase RecJ-like protein
LSTLEIINLLDNLKAKHVVLLCHHNADPDAVCSAYAFSSLIKRLRPSVEVEIGAPQGISRLTKHLLPNLPAEVDAQPKIANADVIVILDTNTVQQLGPLADGIKKSNAPVIVIDHHASHPDTENIARISITSEESSSTCEIVYDLYKQVEMKPDEDSSKALFLGIAFDTRHFILANSTTLKNIAELIDLGVNAQETISLLWLPMDFSERIARLKAGRRSRLFKIGDWIVALSHVSAYEASAARAMIDLGAHVAAVAGETEGNVEISLRSALDFHTKTGIHLGKDVAKPLGEYLDGTGGGHATAAGVNGKGDVEAGLKRCLILLKEELSKHN